MPRQRQDQTQYPQQQQYSFQLENTQQQNPQDPSNVPWPRLQQRLLLNTRLERKQISHITPFQEGKGCFVCAVTIGVATGGKTHPAAVATVQM